MPLSEADAITIRDTFDTLPEDAKPLASDWLKRYKDQQDEFGLPLFPSDSAKADEEQRRFFGMFDDLKSVDAGNGIYDQAERLEAGSGDKLRQREASMRFLARQFPDVAPDVVRRDFPLYRDDFAMKAGGKRDMGDGEFYAFAKEQVMKQREAQDLLTRSLDAGFRSAIENAGSLEAFAKVAATAGNADKTEVDASAFLESYSVATATLNKHRGLVREIMAGVKSSMDGGEVDLEPLKEKLLDLPGTERRMVLASLRMQAEKAGEGVKGEKGGKMSLTAGKFFQQVGESAGRLIGSASMNAANAERIIESIPDAGEVMAKGEIKTPEDARRYVRDAVARETSFQLSATMAGPGGVGSAPVEDRQSFKLGNEAKVWIQDAKEREMKRLRLNNEIRTIGEAADPVPNVFASTIGTSGAALLLMAGTRGLAAPALAQAYSNIEYNDLSLKYPTMSRMDKAQIAGLSGAAQSALDFVGVKALDKLPGIKSLISQPLTKQLVGRALARGTVSYGSESAVEAAQDIATPALMAALKSDVPGFDWYAEMRDFWKGRADVAVGLLPLVLLGVGAASVNEYRGAKELLTWNDKMAATGIQEQDRINVIEEAQSGSLAKAQSLFMAAFKRRDPAIAAEYQEKLSDNEKDLAAAREELTRRGMIPDIYRERDGYTVRNGEASAFFKTWDEARAVATESMNDTERAQVELVATMADSFMASTPGYLAGETINIRQRGESLVDRVSAGEMTPENAMEAAVAGGVLRGVTIPEARAIAAEVFGGETKNERALKFREEVEKIVVLGRNVVENGVSKSTANLRDNERAFLTVVEEVVEGRWKGGLQRGKFTKEQGVNWVKLAEAATGETFLEGATWEDIAASSEGAPRALTEAISRIITADVFGRMVDGKRIGPGSVSRGLNLNDREQSALASILKAFQQLFKALLHAANKLAQARSEGKLGEEYDTLFNELTGGSSQLEHDAVALQEAASLIDTSGYSEATPGPNGETFSLRANDAEYMAAVEAGDMEKAQRMVDEAAKAAGFSVGPVYHSTNADFNEFSRDFLGSGGPQRIGFWFSSAKHQHRGGRFIAAYLNLNNPLQVSRSDPSYPRISDGKAGDMFLAMLRERGFDGITTGSNYAVLDPNQIKSADPVTYDDAGNVIPLSQRFNPADDRITYSLRSGDFEARAAAMFSPFQRTPELRMAIARVAKERAMRLGAEWIEKASVIRRVVDMEREAKTREALKADELIAQGVDEKAARKAAKQQAKDWLMEAKKDAGSPKAQREMLKAALRTLDGILSAAPFEVRAKVGGYVKLAGLATDEAMLQEIERRVAKLNVELEKWLTKQAREQLTRIFKKAKPKAEAGEKAKGKLTPEVHAWFALAEEASTLSPAAADERIEGIANSLSQEMTPAIKEELSRWLGRTVADDAEAQDWQEQRMTILQTFGSVLYGTDANPARGAGDTTAAFDLAREVYTDGRLAHIEETAKKRERREADRGDGISRLGSPYDADKATQRKKALNKVAGLKGRAADYLDTGLDASGFFLDLIGDGNLYENTRRNILEADMAKDDAMRKRKAEFAAMLTEVFPKKGLTDRLRGLWELQQIQTDSPVGTLSQLQAMQFTLWFQDMDSREWLESNGYGEEWQAKAEAWLTSEARGLRSWLMKQYAGQYDRINPVFRRLRGVNLPRVDVYGGKRQVEHSKADSSVALETDMMRGGMEAGFTKTRVSRPTGPPKITDALQNYWQNAHQVEHYIAFAETVTELKAVFGHRDFRLAVETNRGQDKAKQVSDWIANIEQAGSRDAFAHSAQGLLFGRYGKAVAASALLFKLSVLAKQAPAAIQSAFKVGLKEYFVSLARVMSGKAAVSLSDMYQSETVQRRLSQHDAEMQQASKGWNQRHFENEIIDKVATTPDLLMNAGWYAIGWTDARFTTVSAAVAYDVAYRDARRLGSSEEEAKAFAADEAALIVMETAQPQSVVTKSLFENQTPMALLRFLFAFQGANRQVFGLTYLALKKGGVANAWGTAALIAGVAQTVGGLIRMMATDDEPEELFKPEAYALGMATAPLTGMMGLGLIVEAIGNGVGVESRISASPVTMLASAIKDIAEGDADVKDVSRSMSILGTVLGGRGAVLGVGWNVLNQLFGLYENITKE